MQQFLNGYKTLSVGILFVVLCAGGISSAQAGGAVGKGVLIVRGGAANTDANYDKEDRDANSRLEGVSILCASKNSQTAAELVQTDKSRNWGSYMSGSSTAVINQGGQVVMDPQPKNPNHCLLNGLKLGQIKGLWH